VSHRVRRQAGAIGAIVAIGALVSSTAATRQPPRDSMPLDNSE
jgi:hypothetical protein